jgi:hypothetical protein
MPLAKQRSVSLPGELHITLGCSPGSLLEGVQDVHGVRELRDVQDSMLGPDGAARRAQPLQRLVGHP